MFCPNCGQPLTEEAQFCTNCGSKIEDISEEENDDAIVVEAPLTVDLFNVPSRSSIGSTPTPSFPPTQAAHSVQNPSTPSIPQVRTEAAPKGNAAKIAIPVVLALVVLGIGFAVVSGLMSNTSSPNTATSTSQVAASSIEEIDGVAAKDSVNDYSWDELSSISEEIAAAADENEALQIAQRYHLTNENGLLDGEQTKTIQLTDGTEARVMVAGFAHDNKAGGGKAGITFLFKDAVTEKQHNDKHTNSVGWERSQIRQWLNSEFADTLPSDLTKVTVEVEKRTNNSGMTEEFDAVTTTSDVYWVPSLAEVYGPTQWYGDPDTDDLNANPYNRILGAEGQAYKVFTDAGIRDSMVSDVLKRYYAPAESTMGTPQGEMCTWWLRSCDPYTSTRIFTVSGCGGPVGSEWVEHLVAVAPGFCV